MLLSSLPLHPTDLFSAQQTPVSRIQLDRRLALLDEADAWDLARIESLLHWSRIRDQEDNVIIRQDMSEVDAINSDFLREIVLWRLELRTIMSALRKRHAGESLVPTSFHGFGKWPDLMVKHWQEKDFGIGYLLPWIYEANDLIEQNKTFELEKLLLNLVWRHYARVGSHHYFDFPAVVIYVLRWDVINRWSGYNKDIAIQRFDDLVMAGLSDVFLSMQTD
ncbi:MAG: DUF2764 family protein [Gammaproteobacteria bacterium]